MTNGFVYFAKQSPPNTPHQKAKNVSSEQIRVLNKLTNGFVYFAKQSLPNGTHLKAKNVSSEQIRVLKKLKMQKVKKGQTDLFAPDGSHHKKRRTLVLSKSGY